MGATKPNLNVISPAEWNRRTPSLVRKRPVKKYQVVACTNCPLVFNHWTVLHCMGIRSMANIYIPSTYSLLCIVPLWTFTHMPFCGLTFPLLFHSYLGVELLGHRINLCLTFYETARRFSTFYRSGAFVRLYEPALAHHYHPKSIDYSRLTLGVVRSMGFDKCIVTGIHY